MKYVIYIIHCENYYNFGVYSSEERNDDRRPEYLFSDWYLDLNSDDESGTIFPGQHVIRYLEKLLCYSCFKNGKIHVTVVNTNGTDLFSIPSKSGYYSSSMISLSQYRELSFQGPSASTQFLIQNDFKANPSQLTRLCLSVHSGSQMCDLLRKSDLILYDSIIEIKGTPYLVMSLCFFSNSDMVGRIDLDASMEYILHVHSTEEGGKQMVVMRLYDSQFFLVGTLRYGEGFSFMTCNSLPVFHTVRSYRCGSSSIQRVDPIHSISTGQPFLSIQRVQGSECRSLTINSQGESQSLHSFNRDTIAATISKQLTIRGRPFLLRAEFSGLLGLMTLWPKNFPSIRFVGKVTSWKNGHLTGRLFIHSTLLFEGSWKDWKMEGKGTKYYMNGKKELEGSFLKNRPHGKCRQYAYDDRDVSLLYEGEFVDGLKEGEGTLRNRNGDLVYAGRWKKDRIDGEGTLVIQDIRGDCEYYVGGAIDQMDQMDQMENGEESASAHNVKGRTIRCKKLIAGMIVEMEYIREYELGNEYKAEEQEDVATRLPEDNRKQIVPSVPVQTQIQGQTKDNPPVPSGGSLGMQNDSQHISEVSKSPSIITNLSNTTPYRCL